MVAPQPIDRRRWFFNLAAYLGILASSIWAITGVGIAAKGFVPLFSLSLTSDITPLLQKALQDPGSNKGAVREDFAADRLVNDINEAKNDLKRAKGIRQINLIGQIMSDSVALSYYWEEAASGGTKSDYKASQASQKLQQVTGDVVRYSMAYAKVIKDPRKKAAALFHAYRAAYLANRTDTKTIANLKSLLKARITGSQKSRVELAVALYESDFGSSRTRTSAVATLRSLIPKLSTEGIVVARLAIAESLAGIDRNGKKAHRTDKAYRDHLRNVESAAKQLSPENRRRVFLRSVAIWNKAEGRGGWDNPPISLSSYSDVPEVVGVLERMALTEWSKGNFDGALKRYHLFSAQFARQPLMVQVDQRILEMETAVYQSKHDTSRFQRFLVQMTQKYLDQGVLDGGSENLRKEMLQKLAVTHKALVSSELVNASKPKASSKVRMAAIATAQTYLKMINGSAEVHKITSDIAHIYALDGQHRKAVALYHQLAKESTAAKSKAKFIALALNSQHLVANWPKAQPWDKSLKGAPRDLEYLANLYQEQAALTPQQVNWHAVAHIGLLYLALGKSKDAYGLWTASLQKSPSHPQAAQAAGLMLATFHQAKAWEALEELARLALLKKIPALHKGRKLPIRDLLGFALYEGGKLALERKQYADAVKKLAEFVKAFARFPTHDEAMFLLSLAYRGNSQFPESIAILVAHVEKYPRSKWHRQALLNGGDWSVPMAFEESTMSFFEKFMNKYPRDKEVDRIRMTLIPLYLGRGLYAQAGRMMRGLIDSNKVSYKSKIYLASDLMDMEERQGSHQAALKAADYLLNNRSTPDGIRAKALTLITLSKSKGKNLNDLRIAEKKLLGLDNTDVDVRDALGQIRFLIAQLAAEPLKGQKIFNLELKDPLGTLNKEYSKFAQIRAVFMKVCDVGESAFCAPALHTLAGVAEETIGKLEDIQLAQTYNENQVEAFESRKGQVLQELTNVIASAQSNAIYESSQGKTTPTWSDAIIWETSADWSIDSEKNYAGGGYVQWSFLAR